jgi:hypothetical protein
MTDSSENLANNSISVKTGILSARFSLQYFPSILLIHLWMEW